MRALIAVTCVAILTFVGYYFFDEYRTYTNQKIIAEARQKKEIAKLLEAAEALKDRTLNSNECGRLAYLTIPEKAGVPALTTKYMNALEYCSKKGRLSAYEDNQIMLLKNMTR